MKHMNPTHRNRTSALLRRIASEIETLTDDQLDELIKRRSPLLATHRSEKSGKRGMSAMLPGLEVTEIVGKLKELPTRDAGDSLLEETAKTRVQLVQIAKALDVPVTKDQTVAQIKNRLVEATIGFRTRSAAIRGKTSSNDEGKQQK